MIIAFCVIGKEISQGYKNLFFLTKFVMVTKFKTLNYALLTYKWYGELLEIKRGVPQASILESILLICAIPDFLHSLCHIIGDADDTALILGNKFNDQPDILLPLFIYITHRVTS